MTEDINQQTPEEKKSKNESSVSAPPVVPLPSVIIRKFLASICSLITTLVYLVIAGLLVYAVIIAVLDAVDRLNLAMAESFAVDLLVPAVQSILFVIVLATLIDLVRSYVKYGRVLLRPILVAGITTMVRKLLVASLTFVDIIGIVIVILTLVVAVVVLGREDRQLVANAKAHPDEYHPQKLPFRLKRLLDAAPDERDAEKK